MMGIKFSKFAFLVISCVLWFSNIGNAHAKISQQEIEVSLRMIGHQVLLLCGDSTSRVMPIKKMGDKYRISFESHFEFNPEDLVVTIDSVILATKMSDLYIVEVEDCESNDIVYSYKSGYVPDSEVKPCTGRVIPKTCYNLLVTIMDSQHMALLQSDSLNSAQLFGWNKNETGYLGIAALVISLLLLLAIGLFFWKKKSRSNVDSNLIPIGAYQFDKRNMKLSFKNNNVELTSKEADLLFLLHSSANETLEREVILKGVWGGEGNYVGRTLDVFISKLRKKLEDDPSVKIANIRGIGYKLVLNDIK